MTIVLVLALMWLLPMLIDRTGVTYLPERRVRWGLFVIAVLVLAAIGAGVLQLVLVAWVLVIASTLFAVLFPILAGMTASKGRLRVQ